MLPLPLIAGRYRGDSPYDAPRHTTHDVLARDIAENLDAWKAYTDALHKHGFDPEWPDSHLLLIILLGDHSEELIDGGPEPSTRPSPTPADVDFAVRQALFNEVSELMRKVCRYASPYMGLDLRISGPEHMRRTLYKAAMLVHHGNIPTVAF